MTSTSFITLNIGKDELGRKSGKRRKEKGEIRKEKVESGAFG
jgi:hypothetical protein